MGRKTRRYGASSSVSFIYGDPLERDRMEIEHETLSMATTRDEWEIEKEERRALFSGLSFEAREALVDTGSDNDGNDDRDINTLPLPPGQEGILNSNAGGEYDFHTLLTALTTRTRLADDRTRADRIQKQVDSWSLQLPALFKSYTTFSVHGAPRNESCEELWEICVMDFNEHCSWNFFHPNGSQTNDSLVRHGYIGATPEQPQLAFSLHLFHVYRQINRVCPKFSIDGLSKALQHVHGLPIEEQLENQLRGAYDAYLAIQRQVEDRTLELLDRRDVASFTTHVCVPCNYEVANEPPLHPRKLFSIDGNNSMQLVSTDVRPGQERIDKRNLPHHRFLESEYVDEFENEVKAGRSNATKANQMNVDEGGDDSAGPVDTSIAWLNHNETEDLVSCDDTCVERWKVAGPDSQKKTFTLFALCDMIRSGELMKYPLATVNALIDNWR
ncbi:hypothetical protein Moror_3554 [Moniliophthora roreri MCA 2997]|uniref:CxC1-like cysteine cluster associated with KDZ transposases domain-containing protein n=2 Tax=Moniliophthora roreri TaxID=221103 RepID=V2XNF8_MONRO|nr:hypothetical protein Moror_3554 [Moniliophthora roreri MCA 2997]